MSLICPKYQRFHMPSCPHDPSKQYDILTLSPLYSRQAVPVLEQSLSLSLKCSYLVPFAFQPADGSQFCRGLVTFPHFSFLILTNPALNQSNESFPVLGGRKGVLEIKIIQTGLFSQACPFQSSKPSVQKKVFECLSTKVSSEIWTR